MATKKSSGDVIEGRAVAEPVEGEVMLPARVGADPLDDPAKWPPEPTEEASPGDTSLEEAINSIDSLKHWLGMRYRVYKMGSKYNPTERDRATVIYMTWAGFPKDRIARYVGMNKETLLNHFAYELEHGRDGMVTDVVKALVLKAKSGDIQAAKLILTNRAADLWDDKRGVPQVTVSVNEPEQVSKWTAEDIERRINEIAEVVKAKIEGK